MSNNQTKPGEKSSKKKLTFFGEKMNDGIFLQLLEISINWKSQEGFE